MTDYDPGWHTRGHGGTRGSRGAPGGTRGCPGGSRIPPAPKRVIKQQNNDPKPWFKVPKVCPDPKGVVFTHLWGIWGHLGALKQRYLVKKPICEKPGFWKKIILTLYTECWVQFLEWFDNFPHTVTCIWCVENCQNTTFFSKIWLCKREKIGVIFSEN